MINLVVKFGSAYLKYLPCPGREESDLKPGRLHRHDEGSDVVIGPVLVVYLAALA